MAKTPKKTDPLTIEEMTAAAELFFPLFNVILERMPKESKIEDVLKVMENVAKLGHKFRAEKRVEDAKARFGFNKKPGEKTDGD